MQLEKRLEDKIRRRVRRALTIGETARVRFDPNNKKKGYYIVSHHNKIVHFKVDKLNRVYLLP